MMMERTKKVMWMSGRKKLQADGMIPDTPVIETAVIIFMYVR